MRLLQISIFSIVALMSAYTYALEPWTPSDAEMASLPVFCKAKMKSGPNSPEYKMWAQNLGSDFSHTHHYCAGLNFLNRSYRAISSQDKLFNLQNAVNNFDYMVTHAAPTYSLMPDIYLNRGMTYFSMNQDAKAVNDLNKALEINPKTTRAYIVLADYYIRTKRQKEALQILTEGLRHNPEARGLQQRYDKLGGKKPYPEPYAATETAPEAKADNNKPIEATSPIPGTPAPAQQASEKVDSKKVSGSPAESGANKTTAPPPPAIGSPTNPYCRFCPAE